ncbi:hypothetical protein GCK72_022550 [Caenorhabditis remanei]|uniref:Uncharacterized protein n=1 Tax=Caenorhabditis remanei TaxID=31234 RepID=A0A6A5FU11_CAERE|nr:hypothetical protein GCK72_022550 [Caenorhabditis remanei]KAF1746098.1 hypothetical protein GCK72_022550 [Caenorhabditis remanei]
MHAQYATSTATKFNRSSLHLSATSNNGRPLMEFSNEQSVTWLTAITTKWNEPNDIVRIVTTSETKKSKSRRFNQERVVTALAHTRWLILSVESGNPHPESLVDLHEQFGRANICRAALASYDGMYFFFNWNRKEQKG